MKVLIAEDNRVSRSILGKLLAQWGHEVIAAADGGKVWQLLQNNDIRMVITDWIMPHMDGVMLCRKIREAELPHYVYIIILTAKDQKKDSVACLEAGADDYITKPFAPEELRARIRSGERIIELEEEHKNAHMQLIRSEKMASIGQLAAGMVHEINNPVGFINSNLNVLTGYDNDTRSLIAKYRAFISGLKDRLTKEGRASISDDLDQIAALEKEIDIDFILDDTPSLIKECKEGTERIEKIVLDLKDFAHPGEQEPKYADINRGLDSTVNVVWNELKYKAKVTKEYGNLPEVRCYPQQLNQVFVNTLVNAAQAIEKQGEIKIVTMADNGFVKIKISDTGGGIPKENISKIFDPFFTTKQVGKGTGLGMNVALNIIKKHKGTIDVESTVGKGTTFIIRVPVEPVLPGPRSW